MPLLEGLYPAAEKLGHNLIIVVTNTRFSSATELTIVIYYTIADLLCENEFLRATLHQRRNLRCEIKSSIGNNKNIDI
jgi:hypothetical protein